MLPRGWAALAFVVLMATTARAQTVSDELGIERFRPAIDRTGILDVESGAIPGHMSWSAGLLLGFAHNPLVLYDREMNAVEPVVEQRMTATLVAAIAAWDRVELGLTADIVGFQSGSETLTMRSLPGGGIGDLRLVTKLRVAGTRQWQLALVPVLTLPAGDGRGYLREAGVMFSPALAASAAVGTRARVALNAGYHLKSRVETAGLVSDDEAFARAGVALALGAPRRPAAELFLSSSLAAPVSDRERNQVAIELLAGGARKLTPSVGLFIGGGVGLDNGFGTPDWRAFAGVRFEAAGGDADGDRVAGAADRCPEDAEDTDGFEDSDGCPELDNDRDGVADDADRCANDREDKDGFQDGDGCLDADNDGDGVADTQDRCAAQAEDKDGFQDGDGCVDGMSRIAGRVVDPDGRPIRGATVTIAQLEVDGAAPIELAAGDDGSFASDLHGGSLKVSARAPEYQDGATDTQIAAGATGDVSIKLVRKVRAGQLRGQVLSFGGQPLAATITVKGATTTSATADAEGNFTIELPAGAFSVEISADGHLPQKRNVNIKLDGVTVLNVDLRTKK